MSIRGNAFHNLPWNRMKWTIAEHCREILRPKVFLLVQKWNLGCSPSFLKSLSSVDFFHNLALSLSLFEASVKFGDDDLCYSGISSFMFTKYAEGLYLHSCSEIQRITLSSSRKTIPSCSLMLNHKSASLESFESLKRLNETDGTSRVSEDEDYDSNSMRGWFLFLNLWIC